MIVPTRILLLGLLAAAHCAAVHATNLPPSPLCDDPAAPMVYPWSDPTKFATPRMVVPPVYPADRLKNGVTTQVEAILRISGRGFASQVLSIKSGNGDEAFEKAVKDVLRYWEFESYTDCECKPVESTARLTVWFEIKEGKPSISVSSPPPEANPGVHSKPLPLLNEEETRRAVVMSFPRGPRRLGHSGIVYAMSTIANPGGTVESVKIVQVDADKKSATSYATAAAEALKTARYDLSGVDPKQQVRTCYTLTYILKD